MKLFRLALTALLSALFVIPALAQYPMAWSAFRDLGLHSSEQAMKMLNAPGGGGFILFGDTGGGSQAVVRVDDTGAMLWNRMTPGAPSDCVANNTGIAMVGRGQLSGGGVIIVAKYDLSGGVIWTRTISVVTPGFAFNKQRIAIDWAGNVIVAATINDGVSTNISLYKLAAATGATLFNTIYGTDTTTEQMNAVSVDLSNNIFIVGTTNPSGVSNVVVLKYNPAGAQQWAKLLPGASPILLVDTSGNSYVVQSTTVSLTDLTEVTKLSPTGTVLWQPTTAKMLAVYAVLSPSGSVFIAGLGTNISLAKVSSAGTFSWSINYPDASLDTSSLQELRADSSDNFYVSCTTSTAPHDAALVKFNSSGAFVWKKTEAGSSVTSDDQGKCVVLDPAGRVIWLTRVANVAPTYADFRAVAFDSGGNKVWGTDYDLHHAADRPTGAVTDPIGNTYVLSQSPIFDGFTSAQQFAIAMFSSTGTLLWQHGLSPLVGVAPGFFPPQMSPLGGVVIVQTSPVNQGIQAAVYRYDANGVLLWTYNNFPGRLFMSDYKVGSDGSVYVALKVAISDGGTGFNNTLRLMKLNPNGTLAWTVDKPGGVSDAPHSLVLDSNSNAYMNFYTQIPATSNYQMGLVKFNANGSFAWAVPTGDPTNSFFSGDLAIDPSGNLLTFIPDPVDAGGSPRWVYKFDGDGNFLWSVKVFDNPEFLSSQGELAMDALGNIFMWASVAVNGVGQGAMQKITPDGSSSWITHFSQTPSGGTRSLAPDGLGGVSFGGNVRGVHGIDYEVIKFAANGVMAWPALGGAFTNGALLADAIGVDNRLVTLTSDRSGNLFATGSDYGPGGTTDLNVVKYMAHDSAFVNQFVGSAMAAGQTYQAAMTFKNTGFETWTNAEGYRMITLNSSTWGIGSVYLGNSEKIAPGQSKTFYFYVNAPTVAGTYNLQCKMYKNGLGSFGSLTISTPVTVMVRANAARNLSVTAPTTVKAGTTFSVSVDMRNVGTASWTAAAGFALSPTTGFPTWGVAQVVLAPGDSIVQNGHKIFTFNCTAPVTPGTYKMSWQMKVGATFFGDQSIAKTIVVTP